jgi:hypothetical protein
MVADLVSGLHCGHVRVCRAHHPWLPVTPISWE